MKKIIQKGFGLKCVFSDFVFFVQLANGRDLFENLFQLKRN